MLVAANKPLTTWVNVNLFQSAVVCIVVIAMCGCDQGQPADFFAATKKAAESGDAIAQANLGWMYQSGEGVPKDYAEAMNWFRLAADQGDAVAQRNLGVMYGRGQGVPQDYAEAVKWYRLAADQGYADAQSNLALMYDLGQGVPQDYAEAMKWYRLAANQGDATVV